MVDIVVNGFVTISLYGRAMSTTDTASPAKSFFGILFGLIPILWFGGLAVYFYRVNDNASGMFTKELGPTIVGLGFFTILFCIPLVMKLIRFVGRAHAPVSLSSSEGEDEEEGSGFDADAAIARHLARRAAEGNHPPLQPMEEVVQRPSFGRKVT